MMKANNIRVYGMKKNKKKSRFLFATFIVD